MQITPNNDFTAANLFDGSLSANYSLSTPSMNQPTVILIENLPQHHTQAGAWVGWTTRYCNPVRFKIEGYGVYNSSGTWKTLADYSNTDYNEYDFITAVTGDEYTKLRFTFYQGDPGYYGKFGISELFFIHPEATYPYEGLIQSFWGKHNRNLGIGTTDPQYTLDVNGTAQVQKLLINTPTYITNWNNLWQSGFYDSTDSPSAPEASGWFWGINMGHISNSPSYRYGGQIAIKNNNTSPTMYFRSMDVNGVGTWAKILHNTGNQGINGNLAVDGTITAKEVKVQINVWSDFVFADDYNLRPLSEVNKFIQTNGHLPEIPSEQEVKENGVSLVEMQVKLLQKIEELTLYIIEQDKKIKELEKNSIKE